MFDMVPFRQVTPQHFGARGDGVTDDAPAFQEMFNWVMREGGWEEIIIPPVRHLIGSRIDTDVVPLPANNLQRGLRVRGCGPASIIVNANPDGFFNWDTPSSRHVRAHFSDFSIEMAAGGNNGDLLSVKQAPGGLTRVNAFIAENILIYPADIAVDHYTRGITAYGVYWPLIQNCAVANPYGPGVSTPTQHQGVHGIGVDECYGPQIKDCRVWGGARGLSYDVQTNPGGEGGLISNCVFDSDVGIYAASMGTEPALEISGVHANCMTKGIHLVRKKLVNIRDCLLYDTEAGNYVDIDLEDCEDITVRDTTFHFGGNSARTHIKTRGSSRIHLQHNKHRSDGTAMDLAGTDIYVTRPTFNDEVDAEIVDSGVTGLVVEHSKVPFAEVGLSAPQSIPNLVETAVNWNVSHGAAGFDAAPAAAIIIPADKGIRRVRLTLQARWGLNASGTRAIRFTRNGVAFEGDARANMPASGLSFDRLVCETDCVDGDEFRVLVRQDSGVSQNFGPDVAMFRVEAI